MIKQFKHVYLEPSRPHWKVADQSDRNDSGLHFQYIVPTHTHSKGFTSFTIGIEQGVPHCRIRFDSIESVKAFNTQVGRDIVDNTSFFSSFKLGASIKSGFLSLESTDPKAMEMMIYTIDFMAQMTREQWSQAMSICERAANSQHVSHNSNTCTLM